MKVSLTTFTWKHVPLTFKWLKNPALQHLFLIRSKLNWKKHQAYFKQLLRDPAQKVYGILYEGQHIGNCGLKNIDYLKREGELWIYIGDFLMHGKGIGKCATQLLIKLCFETLGLDTIYLHVADFNRVAQNMYRQLGFRKVTHPIGEQEWEGREYKVICMRLKK